MNFTLSAELISL